MSSQNQSNSPTSSSPSPSSSATPAGWRELSGFRETCLLHLESDDARALRAAGAVLHRLALDGPNPWPGPGSALVLQARAILADLRYAQGYLAMMGDERRAADLPAAEEELAQAAEQAAHDLASLTQTLETGLA
jgi:hypothetical protein